MSTEIQQLIAKVDETIAEAKQDLIRLNTLIAEAELLPVLRVEVTAEKDDLSGLRSLYNGLKQYNDDLGLPPA